MNSTSEMLNKATLLITQAAKNISAVAKMFMGNTPNESDSLMDDAPTQIGIPMAASTMTASTMAASTMAASTMAASTMAASTLSLDDSEPSTMVVYKFELSDGTMSFQLPVDEMTVLGRMACGVDSVTIRLNIELENFCIIAKYLKTKVIPPRMAISNWASFARTCDYLGIGELPKLIIDDPELVYQSSLTTEALLRREIEKMFRVKYQNGTHLLDIEGLTQVCEFAGHSSKATRDVSDVLHAAFLAKDKGIIAKSDLYMQKYTQDELRQKYPYNIAEHSPRLLRCMEPALTIRKLQESLKDFPWAPTPNCQVVLAGGAVTGNILITSRFGDFDFFLITRDKEAAKTAVRAIANWVMNKSGSHYMGFRSQHAVSFTTTLGIYQVVLRLYNSIEQVLCNFDIDCCCFAFDGVDCLSIPRGVESLRSGIIMADPERQSTTYARRLQKYMMRGFKVAFPGLSKKAATYLPLERVVRGLSVRKNISNNLSFSMIERILWQGDIKSPYESDYSPPMRQIPFTISLPQYMSQCASSIYGGYAISILACTRDISLLLDTPEGNTLEQMIANQNNPDYLFTLPGAVPSSISFMENLGNGQDIQVKAAGISPISGSFQPLSMRHWYPNEPMECADGPFL